MKVNSQKGFTLVEILIVFAIITIILSIAIPNYIRSRQESLKNSCIANLKQINSAIDQWVLDNNIPTATVPSGAQEDEIYSYLKGSKPICRAGGEYTMHAVGNPEQVTCSLQNIGHRMDVVSPSE